MSEVIREFYISALTGTADGTDVTLSPVAGLDNRPATPPLRQITVSTQTGYSPCAVFTSVASCGRYEVTIRRKS